MNSSSFHGKPVVSAERRDEILQELADVTVSVTNKQLDTFTTRLADALLRVAELCIDPEQGQVHASAAALLKKNRYPFCYIVTERLTAVLQAEIQAATAPSFKPANIAGTAKPLDADVEIDKKLCLLKAARSIESQHPERMTALLDRLAQVIGRTELPPEQNPFRSHLFLAVIHDAWCEFHPDAQAHHLVFPLLGPDLSLDMGSILHALNTVLARRGITVKTPRTAHVIPTESAAPAVNGLTQQLRSLFPASSTGTSTDRPLPGAFPSLFEEDKLQEATARNAFLDYVSSVHKSGVMSGPQGSSLLAHLRAQAPQGSLTQEDATAVDLLIKIFDVVFRNRNIPTDITALIGSLQVPVLKAVLVDKDFFFKEEHPARRVIELMAHLGVGWNPESSPADPVYQIILRNVKRIYADQRAASFSEAEVELDAFLRKEEASATQALSTPITQALQKEKMLQATRAAKHEVALRIGNGDVAAFVETFLENKWVPVLTLAYCVQEEKPQAVTNAVQTMDDLIWSVQPKLTAAERKEMLSKLPGIVAMLNKWLDLIKWNDAERVQFFNDLARTHASIVRAPVDMTPERQVEIAIEAATRASERRLRQQSQQPVVDEFLQKVQRLERGAWVKFNRAKGATQTFKLAWVSPMHTVFVFSTRERQVALSLSDEQLSQALRDGHAQVALEAGVVGHALAEALSANSAAEENQTAA